ncbi:phage holin family protein [Candidatus Beckwithbacteria bacterium]|nr:phage holin family protein [Candidatus Beckwithbacteria bacterium]
MLDFFRKTAKRWFRNILTLMVLAYIFPGFVMPFEPKTILLAASVLLIIQMFFQPLLKMLFLPINIITLGMFKWLITSSHLIITALILETIYFRPFSYGHFSLLGLTIPDGEINIIFSVILATILYRYIRKIITFLT